MTDPFFEICVRAFYTCKDADLTPSTTVLVQADGSGKMPDWDKLLQHLVKGVAEQIHGVPLKEVRAMTRDEVDIYRAEERAHESEPRLL